MGRSKGEARNQEHPFLFGLSSIRTFRRGTCARAAGQCPCRSDTGFGSEPHRYKILYGGRAGIKSWSIAQFLLRAGCERPLRIPCARKTMQSIRESVHQLLEDQITRLGLQGHYPVQKAEILGRRTQTSFTFHSLRWISFNPKLETDDTYQRFVVNPPPNAVVCIPHRRGDDW